MTTRVNRRTVDLSGYPDLVVIYLGMRVNRLAGIKTFLGFGPKISASTAAKPDGLLRHEIFVYSLLSCISAFASTGKTPTHCSNGRVRLPTGNGGKTF